MIVTEYDLLTDAVTAPADQRSAQDAARRLGISERQVIRLLHRASLQGLMSPPTSISPKGIAVVDQLRAALRDCPFNATGLDRDYLLVAQAAWLLTQGLAPPEFTLSMLTTILAIDTNQSEDRAA